MKRLAKYKTLEHSEWISLDIDNTLEIFYKNITELEIFTGITYLNCSDNHIKKFVCSKDLEVVKCFRNELKILVLNNKLEYLQCCANFLRKLKPSKSLSTLTCYKNLLKELEANKKIEFIHSDNLKIQGLSESSLFEIIFIC